ncbi:MAG: ABC transporter ATP-binding protein [Rubrivivax sp.]|nr:ABC transporter ATP-binding protein [Rubrivivax sp.]
MSTLAGRAAPTGPVSAATASPGDGGQPAPLALRLRGVHHAYAGAGRDVPVLDGVDLDVARGEFVAVVGASGSGKSTLLHVLAGLERTGHGEVEVGGRALHAASEAELSSWRGRSVGVVFQFFQLPPTLTALENVMLPMDYAGTRPRLDRPRHALRLLERLGVAEQAGKLPAQMSGGQQQRVAVARALANDPPLLLADEPTGNLDSTSGAALLDLLAALVRDDGLTLVMVTHDAGAVQRATRTLRMADGRLLGPLQAPATVRHGHA